jgi:hypothetical protein
MDNTDKEKIYLGFVPNDKKALVRKTNVNMILKFIDGSQQIKPIKCHN